MASVNIAFMVCSGLVTVLTLLPRPWHLQSWNTGALLYRFWAFLGAFNLFVNSVIWRREAINKAHLWCETSTRIVSASGLAIPMTAFCINRRVFHIATWRKASLSTSKREGYCDIAFDLFFGFALPLLAVLLRAYSQLNRRAFCTPTTMRMGPIVPGSRLALFEGVGCLPLHHKTPFSLSVMYGPPLLISLFSGTYAVRSIIVFRLRKVNISNALSTSNFNPVAYSRLAIFSGLSTACLIPTVLYFLVAHSQLNIYATGRENEPLIGSEHINPISSHVWRSYDSNGFPVSQTLSIELNRWGTLFYALSFFAFFGTSAECCRLYTADFKRIARRLGITRLNPSNHTPEGLDEKPQSTTNADMPKKHQPPLLPISFRKSVDSVDTTSDMATATTISDSTTPCC